MVIKQLSVFVENKHGRLAEILDIIAKADCSILALTIADTTDFGILRVIVQDTDKAKKALRENGLAVSIGRLRDDIIFDYKFVCLSHNTLRGAAGGAVLMAELLAAKGYFD